MTDLTLRNDLLNNLFDGYKLGNEPLDLVRVSLISGINKVKRDATIFNCNYVLSQEMQNHLYYDCWSDNVYYLDKDGRITQIHYVGSLQHVFQCSSNGEEQLVNGTLSFPTENLCVATIGSNILYLIITGERSIDQHQQWFLVNGMAMHRFKEPVSILHSNMDKSGEILHILLIVVMDDIKSSCILHWLQINVSNRSNGFAVKGWKSFKGANIPKACWFDVDHNNFSVCSEFQYYLVNTSTYDIIQPKNSDEETNGPKTWYRWNQCKELVTIIFDMCLTESEVACTILHNAVSVKLNAGNILLEGNLEKDVIQDACKWYINDNRLEIVLVKKESGVFWNSVVPNEKHGLHEIKGEEQLKIDEVHEQLKHLTSDETTKEEEHKNTFNMQQLDDCDENIDEDIKHFSVDVFTGKIDLVRNLAGHQWIFSSRPDPRKAPTICLRIDVDGVVWLPEQDSNVWNHVATFDALGYVHASKQDRKFVACSPSHNFVVITDCVSHIYVYQMTGLGKRQRAQYVSTLEGSEQILGCRVTEHHLIVLTDKNVNIFTLPM